MARPSELTRTTSLPSPWPGSPSGVLPWLWVAAAAMMAALLTPRQEPFPYHYTPGQAWSYPTLRAPYDFDVLFPEANVRSELDRIAAEHGPYLVLDSRVAQNQKQKLAQLLDEQRRNSRHDTQYADLERNARTYLFFGQKMLDQLYQQGMVDAQEANWSAWPADTPVYVLAGREERPLRKDQVLTLDQARLYLADTLPYSPLRQPELILPLLEKTLRPNLHFDEAATASAKRKKMVAVMSTGISVRKGEVIAERGQVLSAEIVQKLDSLARRYEQPQGAAVMAGYFVLAALAFGAFMFWLLRLPGMQTGWSPAFLLVAGLVLLTLLLIHAGHRLGAPLALLAPLWALPLALHRWYGQSFTLGASAIFLFMTMLAVDWSAGWLALQVTGSLTAWAVYPRTAHWPARIKAALLIASLQVTVWIACAWAERIPDALKTFDVALFILAGALFSLAIIPLVEKVRGEKLLIR